MLKYFCDHCGKELNLNDDYIDEDVEFLNTYHRYDLCDSCRQKLQTVVGKTIEEFCGCKNEKENNSR